MKVHPVTWSFRVLWILLPLTGADAVAAALDGRSRPVVLVCSIGCWALWAAVLVASVVPLPYTLTAVRIVAPAAVVAIGWALLASPHAHALGLVGLALAAAAAVVACTGWVADDCVDGNSYGDERRFSLRAPGGVILGPLEVAWAAAVAGAAAGPLLLAARRWVPGAVVLVVGWAVAAAAVRSIHTLSTRFVVFVPAGMTLVDPLSLVDAILMPRRQVVRFAPALADSPATDLSQRALGLAVEADLETPTELTIRVGRKVGETAETQAIIFTPSRAGAVLDEARARGIRVG